jgi:predicted DNA-binding protein with PD1-like motif
MDYVSGKIGRVFVLRLDGGEDILGELENFAVAEDLHFAFMFMLGAASEGNIVVGPKVKQMPPQPIWFRFTDPHELIGIGNIFRELGKTKVHLHAALGRDEKAHAGCMREINEVYAVAEILILEIEGPAAERIPDKEKGISPICFKKDSRDN